MRQKIVVGPINQGLRNDVTPFNVDNDAFPVLINAYQWRSRVKRKRGTRLFGRLQRYFDSTSTAYNAGSTTITLDASGNGNLLTGWSLQSHANIVPGSVTITDTITTDVYTDPSKDGALSPSGSINYATGAITIAAAASHTVKAQFIYNPALPVLGLEDFFSSTTSSPSTLAFDTTYSYNCTSSTAPYIYNVSWYKNPASNVGVGYTHKTTPTPVNWNGGTYQQFWTTNYQNALWATNGIPVPFSTTNIGMQFAPKSTITYTSNTATTLTVSITNCPLIEGDFVFVNEWTASTTANAQTLNLLTGFVTSATPNTPPLATKTIVITFPKAKIATDTFTPGIIQYLTNSSDTTKDCLRWYDGDPTDGASPPALTGTQGWVNFMPPLSYSSSPEFPIDYLASATYYLVGAKMILNYKDRLLFFGPIVQTSTDLPIYLHDTLVYSQNGTAYYNCTFDGSTVDAAILPTTIFYPSLLLPTNQTGTPNSYFYDVAGYGGWITTGQDQTIYTVSANLDVLIVGCSHSELQLTYTSNDLVPFVFYIVNSELGSTSSFSIVNMDQAVLTKGNRGFIATNQNGSQRFDLQIPDEIFQVDLLNQGEERVCAARDYQNEWMYFTYPSNTMGNVYPTQTLQYNYRDKSWAIFNESYTTYGSYRPTSGWTWATIGNIYPTWNAWNVPWNSGETTAMQPLVIGGNQEGFIMVRAQGTDEAYSLYISGISSNTVTCYNHCLNTGDFITITGALGTVASYVNGIVFSVTVTDDNTIQISEDPNQDPPPVPIPNNVTYLGNGTIKRYYIPFIQTRQFPLAWEGGRKIRLGAQQYLLTKTTSAQMTLYIYLSQDASNPYNSGGIVPSDEVLSNALVYSTILYTSPENYIQACKNQSLGKIGDGSSTSFTLDYDKIFSLINAPLVPGTTIITIGSLATFTDKGDGTFSVTGTGDASGSSIVYLTGEIKIAFTAAPAATASTTNFSYYIPNIQSPTALYQQQIWHRVNTSLLGDTVQVALTISTDQMYDSTMQNQTAEIEVHSMIFDLSPSSLLA